MHASLSINEVQTQVFSYVSKDKKSLQSLARLACTCKTFSSNALKQLWSELPNLGVLVRTLPNNLWIQEKKQGKKPGIVRLKESLSEGDMDRFNYYAPMIRSITLSYDGNALEQILDYYSKSGEKSFLPNLRDVKVHASSWHKVATVLNSLRSGLRTVDIELFDDDDVDEEQPTSHGLQDLTSSLQENPLLSQSLKKLVLVDHREYEQYGELPKSTFIPLLSLKALQHLTLKITDLEHLNDDWLAEAAVSWHDIRTLTISAVDNRFSLQGLIPLLVHCRKLTTLELHPTATSFDLKLLPPNASNSKIKGKFSLHKSPAEDMDPDAVFACLKAMFPNVTGVERGDITFSADFASADEDEDEYQEKWDALEELFLEG